MHPDRQEIERHWRWYKFTRCSICVRFIWRSPIALSEPLGVPEPRREWILCQPCHTALEAEMVRSTILSPVRLRIAMGLVAAERSPRAYKVSAVTSRHEDFEREFAWFKWLLILFALLHLAIFAIVWVTPK